jgi:hypothetical protein
MQVSMAVCLHVSAVNCNFGYGNYQHVWEDNIKSDLQEVGCGVWTGSRWLRIGTGGGHL